MLKGHLVVSKVPGTLGPQETFEVTKAENLEDPRNPAGMLGPLRCFQQLPIPPRSLRLGGSREGAEGAQAPGILAVWDGPGTSGQGQIHVKRAPGCQQGHQGKKLSKTHLKRAPGPVWGLGRSRIKRKKKTGVSVLLGFILKEKDATSCRTLNPKP